MCLVALAIDQHPRFPLVLASNRDEFFQRPTAPMDWWTPSPDATEILSGRDLQSGGTWLGLTAPGRLALLTNVRGGRPQKPMRRRAGRSSPPGSQRVGRWPTSGPAPCCWATTGST